MTNKYLEKLATDISSLMPAPRKVTKGADAAMSRQGAYTRSISHIPTGHAKAAADNGQRGAALGATVGTIGSLQNISNAVGSSVDASMYNAAQKGFARDLKHVTAPEAIKDLERATSRVKRLEDISNKALRKNSLHAAGKIGASTALAYGVGKYLDRGQTKAAEEDQEYHPQYLRNATIMAPIGGVAAFAHPAGWMGALAHQYQTGMAKNYSLSGNPEKATEHAFKASQLRRLLAREVLLPGMAAGAAIGVGATALNHMRHNHMDKKAGLFSSAVDHVADTVSGAGHIARSTLDDLTGGKIQKHVIKVRGLTDKNAINGLASKSDEDLHGMLEHGSPEHQKLTELINRRKAARTIGVGAAAYGIHKGLNRNESNNNGGQYTY